MQFSARIEKSKKGITMNNTIHKPFYSLSDFYKEQYGEKVYKLAVDGGFTCPNRDGTIHSDGCIFCSSSGSGDFATSRDFDMSDQVIEAKQRLLNKTNASKFIVYFQAFTNTYDQVENLKVIYESSLIDDSIVGISIGTRPDCLSDEVIELLKDLNTKTDIYIELGLQSIHTKSEQLIRRGYPLSTYDEAVIKLNKAGIPIITHIILGLPNESIQDMKDTVTYVCSSNIQGIKLQLLHILTDTDLYQLYQEKPFTIFTETDYVNLVVELIESIDPSIVIHRITGDGPRDILFEPKWSLNKRHVLNAISKRFKELDTFQGNNIV